MKSRLVLICAVVALSACGSDSVGGLLSGGKSISPTVALAVGRQTGCVLSTSGLAQCWGRDSTFGAVGDGGSAASEPVPVPVSPGGPFVQLSSTAESTCGLATTGRVWCWGRVPTVDAARTATFSKVPQEQPATPTPLVSITVGLAYVCGLDASGVAYCWGDNNVGQLGAGDTHVRGTPTPVVGGFTFVSLGATVIHTCGLTAAGIAVCWGSNQQGALGVGVPINAIDSIPAPVQTILTFTSLAAGGVVNCGIATDGLGYCWGTNTADELATPAPASFITTPTVISTTIHFKTIVPSRANSTLATTCGIATDNTLYCWGFDDHQQAGSVATLQCNASEGIATPIPCVTTPTAVSGIGPVAAVVPSLDHTCAITIDKQVMCWGNDGFGQLGDGAFTERAAPSAVHGLSGVP